MYNRYIRSEAGEIPFSSNFIPVSHMTGDYMNDRIQQEENQRQENNFQSDAGDFTQNAEDFKDQMLDEQCEMQQQAPQNAEMYKICDTKPAEKKTGSILNNLLDIRKINADTLIVIAIALFVLCDSKDDAGDMLIILALLLVLGF